MQAVKSILSTRPVDEALVSKAREHKILLEAVSFIETEAVQSIEIQQEVALAATELATIVFTSMNAVNAVIGMLNGEMPDWRIYCMGQRTQELVSDYFGQHSIAGIADNASQLADLIIEEEETEKVIFFCGNHRRDELPEKLEANGIGVIEITVYETLIKPHRLSGVYDAVLFFSPSAVESFFISNKLPASTVVFAIGNTTAETVKRFCSNHIITAKSPGKSQLVEQAISYFNQLRSDLSNHHA
ncbi:MAG: uroporphyrinogen-III synthase [Chitinophagaceae bacterium]|nr:uroporphyrinogen-III synthase [Chitinophagaceae bacterium]